MYHQMKRSMEVMNSNTVFLTNLWKVVCFIYLFFFGGGRDGQEADGKGCCGFGFFFTETSVIILLACLTLSF